MLAGAGVTFLEGLVINEPSRFHPETFSTASILAVAYLVVFGSMVAFTTYAWLLRNAPLSLVSTYAYVNPVVAVALGTIFLAEPISLRTIIASVVILAAVAIIVTARSRSGRASRPRRRLSRSPPSTAPASGRLPLRKHRPADPPRHCHHRDHRVHPDAGRERRAVRDVEAGDHATARIGTNPAALVRGMRRRIRAHPDRAHLVGRGDRPAVGPKSVAASRASNAAYRRSSPTASSTTCLGIGWPTARIWRAPSARASRAIEISACRVDAPGLVEPVVDPDPARVSRVRPSPPSRVTARSGAK